VVNTVPPPAPALPSGESAAAFIDGDPGAWLGVIAHTALRAGLIGTGLYVAGIRKRLIPAALAASTSIEIFVLSYIAIKKARHGAD
jgi:hypothetical protein